MEWLLLIVGIRYDFIERIKINMALWMKNIEILLGRRNNVNIWCLWLDISIYKLFFCGGVQLKQDQIGKLMQYIKHLVRELNFYFEGFLKVLSRINYIRSIFRW